MATTSAKWSVGLVHQRFLQIFCGAYGHEAVIDGVCSGCGMTAKEMALEALDAELVSTFEDEPDETGYYHKIPGDCA